ncbi:hypothetical protein [Streptomyces violens]|uniref:hypothetical protein n=1 Tax=Streptomyces violens TaxID=66377 RepID=UPI0004C07FAD|nr:hypothetical protein [Streptomyces violens]
MNPLHPAVLNGDSVFRIHWILGTDRLLAVCHCGAEREFDDPVPLWDWLLGHSDDHQAGPESGPAVTPQPLHEVFA